MTLPGKICVAGTVVLCQRSPAKKSNYNNSDCLKFYSTADCRLQVASCRLAVAWGLLGEPSKQMYLCVCVCFFFLRNYYKKQAFYLFERRKSWKRSEKRKRTKVRWDACLVRLLKVFDVLLFLGLQGIARPPALRAWRDVNDLLPLLDFLSFRAGTTQTLKQ